MITGLFNFTRSAQPGNDENVISFYSTNLGCQHTEAFRRLYALGTTG